MMVIGFLNLAWRILKHQKRCYPKKPLDNQLGRVVENRPTQLSEHQTRYGNGVSLMVTYHLRFHDLGRIIRKNVITYMLKVFMNRSSH